MNLRDTNNEQQALEKRSLKKSETVSEKLSATNPIKKDTFQNALRNNDTNQVPVNENTGFSKPALDKKNSFYTTSSQRSQQKNRYTIAALDENRNMTVNERIEKGSVRSGASGNKFPSINQRNDIYGGGGAYEPSMGVNMRRTGNSVKSGSQKSEK